MDKPPRFTCWLAWHERTILFVCLAVAVALVILGVLEWIDEGWWRGTGRIASSAGFLFFAFVAWQSKRWVMAYDSREGDEGSAES